MRSMKRARKMCAMVPAAGAVVLLGAAPADARMAAPRLEVLSTRANLVSGGDAYVRVTLPRGVKASRLRLTVGRRDVTSVLKKTSGRRVEGVVGGLPVTRVPLTARIRRSSAARLFVT